MIAVNLNYEIHVRQMCRKSPGEFMDKQYKTKRGFLRKEQQLHEVDHSYAAVGY